MLKKEWQAIFKHKFLIVVIIALSLVPALYNYIFLGSMWDPYGKLKDLPVAIVNLDKTSELDGKKIKLADDVVSEMKKSKNLDYHFVSQSKAAEGIKSGSYYMVVTFPKNFSENAASLMSKNPKAVQLDYQTTPGHNYISSKMSDSAMTKLKAEVSENITKEYTQAIFGKLSDLKTGMKDAADGARQLTDGSSNLLTGSSELSSHLQTLASSSLSFTNGANDLKVGVNQYLDGVKQAEIGSKQLSNGAQQFSAATGTLANGTQTLVDQSKKLTAGLAELTTKTTLTTEQKTQITQLQQGLTDLNNAIQVGSTDPTVANAVQDDLQSVSNTLQNNLVQNQVAALMQTKGFQSIAATDSAAANEMITAISSSAQTSLAPVKTNLTDVGAQLTKVQQQMQTLAAKSNLALPAATNTITTLSGGLSAVNNALSNQVTPGFGQFSAGLSQANDGAHQLADKSKELQSGSSQLASGLAQLQSNSPTLSSGAGQLADGASQISSGASKLSDGSQTLTDGVNKLHTGTDSLSSGLSNANQTLSKTNSTKNNADKVANPVKVNHTDHDNVAVNGAGMAPYMISVALFIGALATNVVVGLGFSGSKWKSGREFMLAKIGTNGVIALLQAFIVYGAVIALGLDANYGGRMLLSVLLISFAFMAICTFFMSWLGKVGEFVLIVFLVLQLATSAGTYPIQLAPRIFQQISPWLPMSYSVQMLRQTIGLSGHITPYVFLFVAITLIFTGALSIFKKMSRFA